MNQKMERLKADLDAFGRVLRRVFNLRNEFKEIYWNDDRVNLINDYELNFFKMLFEELYDHLIILACKMTDNAESGRNGINQNLTVDYFLKSEHVVTHPFYSEIKGIYEELIKPARVELLEVRNKYLAHQDLPFSRASDKCLPGFKHIDAVIDGVDKIYKLLSVVISETDLVRGPTRGGASYIFYILGKALKNK